MAINIGPLNDTIPIQPVRQPGLHSALEPTRGERTLTMTATGYCSCAKCCGKRTGITASGVKASDNAVAMATGRMSKARGTLKSWLVLAEWQQVNSDDWFIANLQTVKVDGEIIKADTWYMLKDGEFTEVA